MESADSFAPSEKSSEGDRVSDTTAVVLFAPPQEGASPGSVDSSIDNGSDHVRSVSPVRQRQQRLRRSRIPVRVPSNTNSVIADTDNIEETNNGEPKKTTVTFRPYIPGYFYCPSLIFTNGPGPFRPTLLGSGESVFASKVVLVNTHNALVSYMIRCADEEKLMFVSYSFGILAPEEEVVINIISNPGIPGITLEDCQSEHIQVLATAINVNNFDKNISAEDFWGLVSNLWTKECLGFTFPRMEAQLFLPGKPKIRDCEANMQYCLACVENYRKRKELEIERIQNLNAIRKEIMYYSIGGTAILIGAFLNLFI